MAENKKSFLLYCDIVHTVKQLSNEQAGELFKHILSYVNDENPVTDNVFVNLVFEPIKQQLKRDLRHWESVTEKRKEAGKIGGLKSGEVRKNEANEANALILKQNEANEAVTVTDNVTVTVNVIETEKEKKERLKLEAIASTQKRKILFCESLKSYSEKYSKNMINDFYIHWCELNKSGTQMKYEMEKTWETNRRLAKWFSNEKKFHPEKKKESYNVNELTF